LIKSYQNKWVILGQELTENNLIKLQNFVTTLAAPRRGLVWRVPHWVTWPKTNNTTHFLYIPTFPNEVWRINTAGHQTYESSGRPTAEGKKSMRLFTPRKAFILIAMIDK
jgi:hypothetical protein